MGWVSDEREQQRQHLAAKLSGCLAGEAHVDPGTLGLYTMDASNYRHVPLAVVLPRTVADIAVAIGVCRELGVPFVSRGGGTSIGGNASGPGVVLDTSRYLGGVHELDPVTRVARVSPGTVLDDLQSHAQPYGLRYGPDPSTHSRCTIGGMIGNNSCGSHSVAWGRTADTLRSMDVLLYDGTQLTVGKTTPEEVHTLGNGTGTEARIYRQLRSLVDENLALLRTELTTWPRRVSGYGLEHLLPENGFNLARALVGTEGTCATVLDARLELTELPAHRALAVVGFADDVASADAVPSILASQPLTVECVDLELIKLVPRASRPELPAGGSWLFIELSGNEPGEAEQRAMELAEGLRGQLLGYQIVTDPAARGELWRIREEGSGLATRRADGSEAWPGWEDAAVPPERLGSYLRELKGLLSEHELHTVVYGHYGEGCLHMRLDFDLLSARGVGRYRSFMEQAADLVARHGGSLSGEHGDGQARSELLPRMYSPEAIALFERFKGVFDPDDMMNPGIIVNPRRVDADLRQRVAPESIDGVTMLGYPQDRGSFGQAIRRCVGVAKCRNTDGGGVMCPSYRATRDEKHSTRGRARLLAEMIDGEVITDGWQSEEVRESLDLCLSCKGCLSDCPVDVDMATYKAEFFHQYYRGKIRPAAHYSMGWLPVWLRFADIAPGLANAGLANRRFADALKRLGGIAAERELPRLSQVPFTRGRKELRQTPDPVAGNPVVLWPDTFNNHFTPVVLQAAERVLRRAGFEVVLPNRSVCCGLTWLSTGQLDVARRVLRHTLGVLRPYLDAGYRVVGLEPSCTALFRSDIAQLLPGDETGRLLAERTHTLAELLDGTALDFRSLQARAVSQVHCHQHAVLGFGADEQLMAAVGIDNTTLDSGCCGLAGNFGFEAGHYDVSVACAEDRMLPAIRETEPDTLVVSDGFSCRTQVAQHSDRTPVHLAELLSRALP